MEHSSRPGAYETPDPVPAAMPAGFKKPESLQDTIRRLVRNEEFMRAIDAQGQETFDEAEDFDVDDDYDPSSPWEEDFEGQFEEAPVMERKLKASAERRSSAEPKSSNPSKTSGKDPAPTAGS